MLEPTNTYQKPKPTNTYQNHTYQIPEPTISYQKPEPTNTYQNQYLPNTWTYQYPKYLLGYQWIVELTFLHTGN